MSTVIDTQIQPGDPESSAASRTFHCNENASAGSVQDSNTSYSISSNSDTIDMRFPFMNTETIERGSLIKPYKSPERHYIHEMHPQPCNNDLIQFSSPTRSVSASHCRYCYTSLCRRSSVSQCHCNGNLCKVCLIREVVLTYNRSNHEIQCTVCQHPYDAKREFQWKCEDYCRLFSTNNMIFCGLKNEEYLLNSLGGQIGYALVILGIAIWILSTSFVFTFPPYELPLYLYYMIAIFDLIVGIATLWFVTKCRWLSSFLLSLLYCLRFLYLLCGWTPISNILNIDDYQRVHINVLSYFVSFSFVAFIISTVCFVVDILQQIESYKARHQTIVINGTVIDMHTICNGERNQIEH